ncbi:MAG: lysophospholipid acyltransferase family protein [Planctomycetes bacterium]|nr:lysophospholipid acyltransferase family protein [Planctomycetota bacterium]
MKLHKKLGPILVPRIGPWILRRLGGTWRMRVVGEPPSEMETNGGAVLYCFWHGDLLIPMYTYRGSGTVVLVSGHRDGIMLQQVLSNLGFNTVVGSITRGGAMALRGLLSSARNGMRLCVPPDGPKGPACKAKKGVLYLASRAGLPVVPVGVAASSGWRARSWDRMLVPRPFSKVVLYREKTMLVPRHVDGAELDAWTLKLEDAINSARDNARQSLNPKAAPSEP